MARASLLSLFSASLVTGAANHTLSYSNHPHLDASISARLVLSLELDPVEECHHSLRVVSAEGRDLSGNRYAVPISEEDGPSPPSQQTTRALHL